MDTFGGLGVMLIAVFELVGIMWVYGVNHFCENLQFMNGFRPGIVFKVCWVFIAPVMLAVSLVEYPVSEGVLAFRKSLYQFCCRDVVMKHFVLKKDIHLNHLTN